MGGMNTDSPNDTGFFAAVLIGALLIGVPLGAWAGWDAWKHPMARMKGHFEPKDSVAISAAKGFAGGAMAGAVGGIIAGVVIAWRRAENPYP
jgi:hypothetical protein